MCGLEVLVYPIAKEIPNVTQFFVVGHNRQKAAKGSKTSLVVALDDTAGSLCDFLRPFADAAVNLKRIQSRPIVGHPNTYMFLVEIDGTEDDQSVRKAFEGAKRIAAKFYDVGSYPVSPRYQT